MAEILFMENPEIVRSRNMSENDFIDHEDDEDEEDDDSGEYHDFSTMIPHISNSNSQMNPVWQVDIKYNIIHKKATFSLDEIQVSSFINIMK